MGASGSQSESQSQTASDSLNLAASDSQSNSFIDPTQQGFLNSLFGNSQGIAGSGGEAVARGNTAGEQNQGLLDAGMTGLLGQLDPSAQIAQQTDALSSGLGNLFRNEINPTIESNAIAGGGLGGGRQGVAQGVASGQIADAFTQGLAQITGQANQQAQGAASLIPGLAQANIGNANAGQGAGLDIMSQLASILGGPTVLNQSDSRSRALGQSKARGSSGSESASFGFSFV
jgi:hypothetical protein